MIKLNEVALQQSKLIKDENGFLYRDLNKNGKLDIYEDPRQPVEARIDDLISQMTLEEKAGTLFINGSVVNEDGAIDGGLSENLGEPMTAKNQMIAHKMTHFISGACRTQKLFPSGTTTSSVLLKRPGWGYPSPSLPIHATISAITYLICSLRISRNGAAHWGWRLLGIRNL